MKLLFLGTGAADWSMEEHKSLPGFRRNSSALVDDCLLIDPGPHVPDALEAFARDGAAVRYALNTHRHSDHYAAQTMERLTNATFVPMAAGEMKSVGPYTVCAVRANHGTCPEAVHFLISDGEKTLFYGLDGAWLLYDEVAAIQKSGVDFAVLDGTIGNAPGDYRIFEHNNLTMVLEMQKTLAPYVKRFCISHMARTLHGTQQELEAYMQGQGVEVAFDGYETEI